MVHTRSDSRATVVPLAPACSDTLSSVASTPVIGLTTDEYKDLAAADASVSSALPLTPHFSSSQLSNVQLVDPEKGIYKHRDSLETPAWVQEEHVYVYVKEFYLSSWIRSRSMGCNFSRREERSTIRFADFVVVLITTEGFNRAEPAPNHWPGVSGWLTVLNRHLHGSRHVAVGSCVISCSVTCEESICQGHSSMAPHCRVLEYYVCVFANNAPVPCLSDSPLSRVGSVAWTQVNQIVHSSSLGPSFFYPLCSSCNNSSPFQKKYQSL